MSAALKLQPISVDDYLAGELVSKVKHEYVAGIVYAMAGARNVHNLIAGNVFAALHNLLRGGPCRPYNSDTKIRVRLPTHVRFYYPDASVICRPNSPDESFQDEPAAIVEVLSRKTRRTDEGEKKDAYVTIPSLSAYLQIEQDQALVSLYRRTNEGFVCEQFAGLHTVVPLEGVGVDLPLAEIYDGVEFTPEEDKSDEA